MKDNFDKYIFKHIKDNPEKKFTIFFPPYSILAYKYFQKEEVFNNLMSLKGYIFIKLLKLNNVKIFDFQIANKITFDLNNYKDVTHYSEDINNWMVKQMKEKNYLVSKGNYKVYINKLQNDVDSFTNNLE